MFELILFVLLGFAFIVFIIWRVFIPTKKDREEKEKIIEETGEAGWELFNT